MNRESRFRDSAGNHDRVKEIFREIARDYDRVNRVISLGQLDRWRRKLISVMDLSKGSKVLDLGCGTGKLTKLLAGRIDNGRVSGVDMTPEMVKVARENLPPEYEELVDFSLGTGEDLDFPENSFDVVTSAFTLRNVDDLEKVISEMWRVVRYGGSVYSLELAKPGMPIFREIYYFYFNRVLPFLGGLVQGDSEPYRYLAESLKRFPDQDKLKQLYKDSGLVGVKYQEIFGGIAAIHHGVKRER